MKQTSNALCNAVHPGTELTVLVDTFVASIVKSSQYVTLLL